jgi:uncharacterized protein (TIGR02145 family)
MAENLNYQKGLILNQRSDYARGMKYENQPNGIGAIGSFWCNDGFDGWLQYQYEDYIQEEDYMVKKRMSEGKGPIPTLDEMKDRYPGSKGGKDEVTKLELCNRLGALYTWETAVSENGSGEWDKNKYSQYLTTNNICPKGWKLPSENDWFNMLNKIETENNGKPNHGQSNFEFSGLVAGKFLKKDSYTEWESNDSVYIKGTQWQAFNDIDTWFGRNNINKESYANIDFYGFSILPAGYKNASGMHLFLDKAYYSYFWTSTESNDKDAKIILLHRSEPRVFSGQYSKANGMSVRCIKE